MAEKKKKKRSSSAALVAAREKASSAMARASSAARKARESRTMARVATVAGGAVIGGARRAWAAHKTGTMPENTAPERMQKANEREKARLPHLAMLGEAGTYGVGLVAAGLAMRSPMLADAGCGALAAEAYLRLGGYSTGDARAAELRGQSVGAYGDDVIAGDDDDDVIAGELEADHVTAALAGMDDAELASIAGDVADAEVIA